MNSPFVLNQSKHAADKLLAAGPLSDSERVARVYREVLGRAPSAEELKSSLEFIKASADSWSQLYQALFASAEFRYRS
jgi:hypothetical protein